MSLPAAPPSSPTVPLEAALSGEASFLPGLESRYAQLPERFHAPASPARFPAPRLVQLNVALAESLGLDAAALASERGVQVLAGNLVAEGWQPVAMAYAGHQFGNFVPRLGDGRAKLLGEVRGRDGRLYDLHLKGSGRTAFSRGGDGRAVLGPVLREYIVSEAMASLGVPTTRALAAVTTGDLVMREEALPGAVLTRVASSHLRVGTFQYFAARGDMDGLKILAEFAIARHYPELAESARPARGLLEGVIGRQARLIARWMQLGFVHGVMNTDNMSISGETIDYGPCAFMEAYHPTTVFSSIDRMGRYAYDNQPHAAHWNLVRLAEALLPLLEAEEGSEEKALASAQEALAGFAPQYEEALHAGFRRKLGLGTERAGDVALVEDLLSRMAANKVDFTQFFRLLCGAAESTRGDNAVRALFADPTAFDDWAVGWRVRLGSDEGDPAQRARTMRGTNPAYIPRNHLVAEVIEAAVAHGDLQPFRARLAVGARPYEDDPGLEHYSTPARPEQCVRETFCGT